MNLCFLKVCTYCYSLFPTLNVPSDLMPWLSSEPEKKRGKPVPPGPSTKPSGLTLLDKFVVGKDKGDGDDEMDVIVNDDGTMYAAGETND